VGDEQEEIQF